MEKSSLETLQFILTENIFLIKKEIPKILKDIQETDLQSNEFQEPNTNQIASSADELNQKEAQVPDPIQVLGKFEKGILILHEEETLNEEVMDLLVKILQAVGHSLNSVGMVSSKALTGQTLADFHALNAHTVIKFGRIQHPINSLPINNYQIHTEEETEYLFADSLSQIAENKALKAKLWNNLKILFNLA
ncbi:hypothetical protein [Algoriphagus sp.]|uniref:hypothetical protein n=1 Tax=Algoriphagus sp. TaxID=1872435 RepID=UPI002609DB57|nr:hypothetical protein [Algoriphagus sp.]